MQYALRSVTASTPYIIGPFNTKFEADRYIRERLIGPFEIVQMFPPKKETVGSDIPSECGEPVPAPE